MMAKLVVLMFAVACVSQVTSSKPADLGNLMTQGIAKTFESKLNNHMKRVREEHAPFVAALKENGCLLPSKQNIEPNDIMNNIGACVELTNTIAEIESGLYDSYFLAEAYINVTLDATDNATICLKNEDLSLVAICLLKEATVYSSQMEQLNEWLTDLLIVERYDVLNIVPLFNRCFGNDASTLQEITSVHAKQCTSKLKA